MLRSSNRPPSTFQHKNNTTNSSTTKPNFYSVMIHNLPTHASTREIWLFFNKQRTIRDIILPRKIDKNNFRIGFILVLDRCATSNLIGEFSNTFFLGHRLLVKFVSSNISPSQTMLPQIPTTI